VPVLLQFLAERMNWLRIPWKRTCLGSSLADQAAQGNHSAWAGCTSDRRVVKTKPGKTMSVFDTLEDLDADIILARFKRYFQMI
jgi:hypothetical protein